MGFFACHVIQDEPLSLSGGGAHVVLGREEARHATKALRLRPGDRLEVCDGLGSTVVGAEVQADPGLKAPSFKI